MLSMKGEYVCCRNTFGANFATRLGLAPGTRISVKGAQVCEIGKCPSTVFLHLPSHAGTTCSLDDPNHS